MTNDYMKCDTKDLPEAAKQKAVDWARTNKYGGTTDWSIGDAVAGSSLTAVARYIATQEAATKPSTESHEDAAKRIADKYWAEPSNFWFAAQSTILSSLSSGDLVIPPQQAEPVDPDLVGARILATKVSWPLADYTDGKNDQLTLVQHYLGWLKSGLIKMGDRV